MRCTKFDSITWRFAEKMQGLVVTFFCHVRIKKATINIKNTKNYIVFDIEGWTTELPEMFDRYYIYLLNRWK